MERMLRGLKWVWGTSWPLYAALVLGSNLVGAITVMLFLRYLVPRTDGDFTNELDMTAVNIVGIAYVVFAVVVGIIVTFQLFRPVLEWQRSPDEHDPNMVRTLVMRLPIYQAVVCAAIWLLGIVIAIGFISRISGRETLVTGVTLVLAGMIVVLLTYLQAERLVRPVAAEALARRFEDATQPPLRQRLRLTWIMTSGVPIIGIVALILGHRVGYFTDDAVDILPAILAIALAALATGYIGTALVTSSVTDPIQELQQAINQVRRGHTNAQVDIYDGSEIGVLQAGFNEMMRGLKDRQRVRDLFGRYVGTEVAERALGANPKLGGEDRRVAILFVDVKGSTTFAVNHTPEEVVEELNKFFNIVVDTVHRNKGVINKFQGDAALAVFGAPLAVGDEASHALTTARELRAELRGLSLEAGIGVAAGHVVAGHIGGHDRFEYTVIGDAVNQAARLTELAKDTPGGVLTNAATLRAANEAEQARWTKLKSVELRGRRQMTQLARPVRPTLADRS